MPSSNTTTDAKAASAPPTSAQDKARLEKLEAQALPIVKRNAVWSMGFGLLPVPGVDLIGITVVQVKMIDQLAHIYGVPFQGQRVKSILSSLAGTLGTMAGTPIAFSLTKFIPVVGQAAGAIALPLSAGAFTYAVGKVFMRHFGNGGNLLNFEPSSFAVALHEEYEAAKTTLRDLGPAPAKTP